MRGGRQNLTILVVQQETYERERMASLLAGANVDILLAADGREAIEKVNEFHPNIMVTDIALKHLDGVKLMVKAREAVPDIKLVVAFGPYSPKALVASVEIGISAFLRLPVDGTKLREAVMTCAHEIAMARRLAAADSSLHRLLDFFPAPAVLVDGLDVIYMNRPLTAFLGYEDFGRLTELDMGLEDFIVALNGESYGGHAHHWIEAMINDPLDREHVIHVENPRHLNAKPSAFAVTFNQFPGSDLRLFSFQDVSGLEDERALLEDEASTDPLTRAMNRRSFLRRLEAVIRTGKPFGMVMFDIDHFKSINDDYGHDVGDAVLREISQLVRDNIREKDVFARWGGEEFLVLSPGAGIERAGQVAERLRKAVWGHAFTGVPRRVTSSFGVAMHQPGETGDALVKRADQALYEAKESGRNKVVSAT